MGYQKKILVLLGMTLFLVFLFAVLSNRFPLSQSKRLHGLKLVSQHENEDTVYDDLYSIASAIRDVGSDDKNIFDNRVEADFYQKNKATLVKLYEYLETHTILSVHESSSRFPNNDNSRQKELYPRYMYKLVRLLRAHLYQNDQDVNLALNGLTQLGRYLCQNPSSATMGLGVFALSERNSAVIKLNLTHLDPAWFQEPSLVDLQKAYLQTKWEDLCAQEKQILLFFQLQDSSDNHSEKWDFLAPFFMNKEATVEYIFEDFMHIKSGILNEGFCFQYSRPERFNFYHLKDWLFNPIGKKLASMSFMPSIVKKSDICVLIWQNHALQILQLSREQSVLLTKEKCAEFCVLLNLRNPLTLKPYDITEDGKLIAFDQSTERCAVLKSFRDHDLSKLKGLPVFYKKKSTHDPGSAK